ncbi:ABC-2 transporter permease [Ornithinibacillus xuwenensis]|uniref:ABC-2 transporter permease n=1 Tax=Ornithinibacillus xuwenensis TaxID=3144668 RepID=A0ABU9XJY5_9BACI
MQHLLMKEIKVSQLYLLILIVLIPLSYVMNVSSTGINIWVILGFLPLLFYLDSQNNVNRFVASMPIKHMHIVLARYLILMMITTGALLFLWSIDYVAHQGLPFLKNHSFSGYDILQLVTLNALFLSVYIPVFYYFKNFTYAITFFLISFVILVYTFAVISGNPYLTFDEPVIDFLVYLLYNQPIILVVLSLTVLYVSFRISLRIFVRRDLL